jgi:hypothetical protein
MPPALRVIYNSISTSAVWRTTELFVWKTVTLGHWSPLCWHLSPRLYSISSCYWASKLLMCSCCPSKPPVLLLLFWGNTLLLCPFSAGSMCITNSGHVRCVTSSPGWGRGVFVEGHPQASIHLGWRLNCVNLRGVGSPRACTASALRPHDILLCCWPPSLLVLGGSLASLCSGRLVLRFLFVHRYSTFLWASELINEYPNRPSACPRQPFWLLG